MGTCIVTQCKLTGPQDQFHITFSPSRLLHIFVSPEGKLVCRESGRRYQIPRTHSCIILLISNLETGIKVSELKNGLFVQTKVL